LVRDSIARHTGHAAAPPVTAGLEASHASHGRFLRLAPTEDSQCIIEPAVRCNHCGYCQSYGH
ncbi:MAG TPA: hypothetical protein VFP91_11550, partial [Vicinamibacterales bacterium]|nr:hypothetical protein [Vicinamibacterales bacterium]